MPLAAIEAKFRSTDKNLRLRMKRARKGCRPFYDRLLEQNGRRFKAELREEIKSYAEDIIRTAKHLHSLDKKEAEEGK
jgi:hypothetical protein